MDFRERTDPDTKDITITEHWGDDQIQNCRNLAQRVGIAIVTTIAALAPLGKHVFQIIEVGGPLQVLFRESFFNVCLTRFLELKFIIF